MTMTILSFESHPAYYEKDPDRWSKSSSWRRGRESHSPSALLGVSIGASAPLVSFRQAQACHPQDVRGILPLTIPLFKSLSFLQPYKKTHRLLAERFFMAEREGFEPSIPFGMHAFQACALGLYATSPSYIPLYLCAHNSLNTKNLQVIAIIRTLSRF